MTFYVYDESGQRIDQGWKDFSSYVMLKPGLNKLGVYVVGYRKGYLDNNKKYIEYFLDFKWINVTYNKIETNKLVQTLHATKFITVNLPASKRMLQQLFRYMRPRLEWYRLNGMD